MPSSEMPLNKLYFQLERIRLPFFSFFGLLELGSYLVFAPAFWWLRTFGRGEAVDRLAFRLTKHWARRILERLNCKIEIEGTEHIPEGGPLVIMSNHQSLFDIPILMRSISRLVGFVAKRQLFRIPAFAFWMRQLRSVSLDRDDPASAVRLFQQISQRLKDEENALVVFPEGTRTRDPDGRIGPFRDGSIRLATAQKIPILPVSIEGSRYLIDPWRMSRTRRGGRIVRVKIAPLVTYEVRSALERRNLMEEIRRIIAGNFEALRFEWPAGVETPQAAPRPPEASA